MEVSKKQVKGQRLFFPFFKELLSELPYSGSGVNDDALFFRKRNGSTESMASILNFILSRDWT